MRTAFILTALFFLFPHQALASAASECASRCVDDLNRRGVLNSGLMRMCADKCVDEARLQEEHQRQNQQFEYEKQQAEERREQEYMELQRQRLELERQRLEYERQNYQQLQHFLYQQKQCPRNSRGMTAEEKARSPGASCICLEGYTPDTKANTCRKNPTSQQYQQPASDCPLHSKLSADGKACDCEVNYEPDPTNAYCVRIKKKEDRPSIPAPKHIRVPSDVPSNAWYRDALSSFVEDEDVSADEPFRPSDRSTRGDFIRLLVKSMDIPMPRSVLVDAGLAGASFDDVPGKYQDYYELAALKGWVKGEGDCYGRHPCYGHPGRPINRAEAAALIIRAHNLSSGDEAPQFNDVPPGDWYAENIRIAGSHCILKGDEGTGRVRPADTLNRAEMVVMIRRASQQLKYPNCE